MEQWREYLREKPAAWSDSYINQAEVWVNACIKSLKRFEHEERKLKWYDNHTVRCSTAARAKLSEARLRLSYAKAAKLAPQGHIISIEIMCHALAFTAA